MKVNYTEPSETVSLSSIKPGECFKCPRGSLVYMKVYLKRIQTVECQGFQYGVALQTGGVYPFSNPEEYQVMPLDGEVEIL